MIIEKKFHFFSPAAQDGRLLRLALYITISIGDLSEAKASAALPRAVSSERSELDIPERVATQNHTPFKSKSTPSGGEQSAAV